MHVAERFDLPAGYLARPYRGPADHALMAGVLTEYREHRGEAELVSAEQLDRNYAHLTGCDPDRDIYVIETDDEEPVAYGRTICEELTEGLTGRLFMPVRPAHLADTLFHATADALEAHLLPALDSTPGARYMTDATHPGPGMRPSGEAAWLEERGYDARHWGAELVRPHLDDIPERTLPDGVELRPVTEDQLRTIVAAHHECFRGEWDFAEMTERDYSYIIDDPHRDHTLWQVAWAGDQVVGQVKPFINHDENAARGYRRGYTEYISTHRDWRNRGIAGTLLAWSLLELKDRGMTEAALGVDTENPGGAFQLYQSLGFEIATVGAVYVRDVETAVT